MFRRKFRLLHRHLFVEVLKAEEEGPVTKARHHRLRHPLQVHVAGEDGQVGVGDGVRGHGRLSVGD